MAAIFAIMRELNLSLFTFRYCAERTVGYIRKKVKPLILMNDIFRGDFVSNAAVIQALFDAKKALLNPSVEPPTSMAFFPTGKYSVHQKREPFSLSGSEGK